ncbi:MAG: lysophospholipid acyltransferase family protein [Thermodesulfobacteriota bacterium]
MFTTIFVDRFILKRSGEISFTSQGWEYLEQALETKTGGVILMSHVGNWEMAAHLWTRHKTGFPLMLYMGAKRGEQIEKLQKEDLREKGVRILAAGDEAGSPFDILEGINFLKSGGFVSITGDKIRDRRQRTVQATFLGHEVRLPELPHLLAQLSGAPLFALLCFRLGPGQYLVSVTPPRYLNAGSGQQRKAIIEKSAQEYARVLEAAVQEFPFQWYHFEPFWSREAGL